MIRFAANLSFPKTESWFLNPCTKYQDRIFRKGLLWVETTKLVDTEIFCPRFTTSILDRKLTGNFWKKWTLLFSCFSKRLYSIQCGMRHGRIVSNEMLVSVIPSLFIRVICSLTSSFNFFFTYLWAGSSSTRKCVLQVEERDSEISFVLCVA